jgi:hypothetical protein
LDIGKIDALLAFHCRLKHFVQYGQLISVFFCIRSYALRHKVLGDYLLDFGGMFLLVGNPSNQLIIIHRVLLAQLVDFFNGFLDGERMLIDQIRPQFIVIDAAGNLTMGSDIDSCDRQ